MPSLESDAIADQFTAMSHRMQSVSDLTTMRSILEELHLLTSEPVGVTYEQRLVGELPTLWVEPVNASTGHIMVYAHGGGFSANSVHSHRKLVGHLAKAAGCIAVLPDYSLSPEATFPTALMQVVTLIRDLLADGVDPACIVLAGDSAGANLATATAIWQRDHGDPPMGAIVAISPWFDMEVNGSSLVDNAAVDRLVTRAVVEANVTMYLGGASATDPLTNPLHCNPAGLPPIFLTCGGDEAFRDNAERFAERAGSAGVDVRLLIEPGMQHVYPFMAGRAPEADRAVTDIADWLRPRIGLVPHPTF